MHSYRSYKDLAESMGQRVEAYSNLWEDIRNYIKALHKHIKYQTVDTHTRLGCCWEVLPIWFRRLGYFKEIAEKYDLNCP